MENIWFLTPKIFLKMDLWFDMSLTYDVTFLVFGDLKDPTPNLTGGCSMPAQVGLKWLEMQFKHNLFLAILL